VKSIILHKTICSKLTHNMVHPEHTCRVQFILTFTYLFYPLLSVLQLHPVIARFPKSFLFLMA